MVDIIKKMVKYTQALMMKKIGTVVVVVILTGLGFASLSYSMVTGADRGIIVKCNELREQSIDFNSDDFGRPLFWISQSDKEMCDGVNIEISAPIGDPYEKNI